MSSDLDHRSLDIDLRRGASDAYRGLAALSRAAGALDHRLLELVEVRASQINGCTFCVDLHVTRALEGGEDPRRLHALATWRESRFFDASERAALDLTEALTVPPIGPIPPDIVDAVDAQFGSDERHQLVTAIISINAWNRAMIAEGKQPPPLETD